VRDVFRRFDANNTGKLVARELKRALPLLGIAADSEQTRRIIAHYDRDGDRKMNLHEFNSLVNDLRGRPEPRAPTPQPTAPHSPQVPTESI